MYQYLFPSFIDGFSYNQLIDLSGFFYIINPFEKVRNINSGNFVDDSDNVEILNENYIDKFYKKALITNDLISYQNKIHRSNYNITKDKIKLNIFRYDEKFKRGLITLTLLNDNSKNLDLIFIFIYNCLLKNIKINTKDLYEKSELNYYYNLFLKLNDRIKFDKFDDKIFNETKDIKKKITNHNISSIKDIIKICKKYKYDSQKYNSIIKSLLDGDFSEETLLENISDDNNKLIKEELLKNNDIKEYLKLVNVDYDEIISLLETTIKERYSINKFNEKYNDELKDINSMFKFGKYKDELNIIILSFLSSFIHFVYFRENDNTRNIYSNIKLNLKKNYNLENLNNLGFYCSNKNYIENLSNIRKEELFIINPLISNIVENNSLIESNNQININLFIKDNNIKGGFLFRPFIKHSLKLSINTLNKIIPDDLKNNFDDYDLGYVILDNLNNLGIYVVKKENFNIIKIKQIKGTNFIKNFITNKFLSYGFIVINID